MVRHYRHGGGIRNGGGLVLDGFAGFAVDPLRHVAHAEPVQQNNRGTKRGPVLRFHKPFKIGIGAMKKLPHIIAASWVYALLAIALFFACKPTAIKKRIRCDVEYTHQPCWSAEIERIALADHFINVAQLALKEASQF